MVEGDELCRMAIARGNEENSDWINTVVGYWYRFQPHMNEDLFYSGMAIIERLLANFINNGDMPETDMDLPVGFTEKARAAYAARAKEFFERINIYVKANS